MNDKILLETLGRRIREIRGTCDMTQYELADRCGMNRNYIGMLERGERNPTYLTLLKLAAGCGVDIGEFFKDICKSK